MSRTKLSTASIPKTTNILGDHNVEVSNVIITTTRVPGIYSLDALTDEGEWLRALALEVDEDRRDELIRRKIRTWRSFKETTYFVISLPEASVVQSASLTLPSLSGRRTEAIEDLRNDWVLSPEEILTRLECSDTSAEDRITAVLFAETMAFDETQRPRLLSALFEFADKNRFSTDDELTTAVESAIRKFAMNMPESSFEDYSDLLVPTDTDTLSCEIELEVAKAVGWRLIKLKSSKPRTYPNLEARLSELASDYLTPRLILQDNYASIVIHAVIAVCLLNGSRQDEFIDRIAKLHKPWFSDLFARRLVDATQKRQAAVPENVDNLTRLHERLIAAMP